MILQLICVHLHKEYFKTVQCMFKKHILLLFYRHPGPSRQSSHKREASPAHLPQNPTQHMPSDSSTLSAAPNPDICTDCKHMQPKKCRVILVCLCSKWNGQMVVMGWGGWGVGWMHPTTPAVNVSTHNSSDNKIKNTDARIQNSLIFVHLMEIQYNFICGCERKFVFCFAIVLPSFVLFFYLHPYKVYVFLSVSSCWANEPHAMSPCAHLSKPHNLMYQHTKPLSVHFNMTPPMY